MIILYILAAVAAVAFIITLITYTMTFYVSPRQRGKGIPLPGGEQYALVKDKTRALIEELRSLPFESISIVADDGTTLHGKYYHSTDGAPLQIQFHGYRSSAIRDFCGGHRLAWTLGHNILLVDQRAHGESGGRTIGFGVKERSDCLRWANYAAERFGPDTPILLSGISMGAATVLMASALPLPTNVCGVIADSPYSSPRTIIRKVCRDMHLPPALIYPFIRLGARVFGGFDPNCADAAEAVQHSKVPILLIHGEDDRFVPCEMSAAIHSTNPAMAQRETFPGAGHGLSYMVDPGRYTALMAGFAERCTQIPTAKD